MQFNQDKISNVIRKANLRVPESNRLSNEKIDDITANVTKRCDKYTHAISVEDIQDIVEEELMRKNAFKVAKEYITYRYRRALDRKENTIDKKILSLIKCENEEIKQENSNKNPTIISTQRDYMAGEVSKDISRRYLLPEDIIKAHDDGIIHFHDMDYYIQNCYNCCLVNLEDMLQNGTVISGTKIDTPKSFLTACNIATQIAAQVASSQYGGQSMSLAHLAPFVDVSRKKIDKQVREEFEKVLTSKPVDFEDKVKEIVEERVREEVKHGVQTIQYQVTTLQTTNGQAPFITIFMYLNEAKSEQEKADLAMIIEEVLKQRIQGTKNSQGIYVTPAFPKLIYVLEEDNITENSKYYYLTELAARCTAKRMVPDYISEKVMKETKEGNCFPPMGCRSCLSSWKDENGNYKFYGRFNQGVVTIDLIDVALSADRNLSKFWPIFEERLELCHRALLCRYKHLKGTKSDVAPILWQHGAIARLKPGETIDKLLVGGYSTISLGYAGLWETVLALSGKKLTESEGEKLGVEILEYMNKKVDQWKAEDNLGYGIYGTPLESTTYKFAKCLQKRFGVIPGITDKNYVTNSYHIHVTENVDAFTKLATESKFQRLSTGGAISYIEAPNLQNNIPAVLTVIKFIYNNIMYAEINIKSDYCMECGWDGEIEIKENADGKLYWRCPCCGNTDQTKMSVARRTCGYIGSQFWNQRKNRRDKR